MPLALLALGAAAACAPRVAPKDDLELLRARNAVAQGRYDWARIHYGRDHERHPERLSSLREHALCWLSGYQQSLSRGTELLREYHSRAPGDTEAARSLVRALLLLGEQVEARERAALLPADPDSDLLRAQALLDADTEAARRAIEGALAGAPDDARVQATAAEVYERSGEADRSRTHAERAVALDPLRYTTLYQLARLHRKRGEHQASARYLRLHQDVTRLLQLGTLAPLPPAEALSLLDRIQGELGEGGFPLRKRRVRLLLDAGRLQEAVAAARGLSDDPQATLTDLLELATWTGEHGRHGEARQMFEGVLRRHPGNAGAVASLAQIEIDAGRLAAARARLTEASGRDAGLARFHLLLGRVERREGRLDAARERLERAVELAPWEWSWRKDLGDVLLAQGRDREFRAVLRAAPEEAPGLAEYARRHGAEAGTQARASPSDGK
jgi:tetratricopeptide (TPR) repeat protein